MAQASCSGTAGQHGLLSCLGIAAAPGQAGGQRLPAQRVRGIDVFHLGHHPRGALEQPLQALVIHPFQVQRCLGLSHGSPGAPGFARAAQAELADRGEPVERIDQAALIEG
jgi:hypothetical protein